MNPSGINAEPVFSIAYQQFCLNERKKEILS